MDEPATDERAALKELERLQEQIQHYRAQRRAAGEKFEQFIRSFKAPAEAEEPLPPAPAPAPRAAAPPPAAVVRTPEPSAPPMESVAPSGVVEPRAAPLRAPPPLAKPQARQKSGLLIGGALALLAGGAVVTWTLRPRAPEPSSTGTATPIAPPARPAPEPPPVTPAAPETALTTSRAVWVRVIADGENVLERELPGNTRVPLKAEKSIVIRTGDAGAISLTLKGRDQGVLGRAGEVATRTFTVPARQ